MRPEPGAQATEPVEDQAAAAPEAAAPQIVTEAERAPRESARPRARPATPPRTAETAPRPAPETPAQPPRPEAPRPAGDPVAEAIAAELARQQAAAPAAPAGPPLSGAEREGLRLAVQECWNVGALSSEAMRTTVTLALSMNPDGTPRAESIRMIGNKQWRDIEMTFNPESMRIR
ncbi:MAG: hypothetical protein CVT80_05805 [Alphaproteobacteria bacterium HGW-Alphaproteobacteria-2]|nr:MAG: hypothetical protein CVT80_05805 [Alphaproteobacteria bacterium HGW-Alphaproteobacteria-2]